MEMEGEKGWKRKITNFLLFARICTKKIVVCPWRTFAEKKELRGMVRISYVWICICTHFLLCTPLPSGLGTTAQGMTKLCLTMTNILENIIMKSSSVCHQQNHQPSTYSFHFIRPTHARKTSIGMEEIVHCWCHTEDNIIILSGNCNTDRWFILIARNWVTIWE